MGQRNKKKTYAEIEAELKFLKRSRRSDAIAAVGQAAFKYGAIVGVAYYGYKSVSALAGQATNANLMIELFGNSHVAVAIGWTFGIGGIIYGRRQRSLRKDVIERLSGRIAAYEKEIDIRRSSSRLTVRGDTPEDAI